MSRFALVVRHTPVNLLHPGPTDRLGAGVRSPNRSTGRYASGCRRLNGTPVSFSETSRSRRAAFVFRAVLDRPIGSAPPRMCIQCSGPMKLFTGEIAGGGVHHRQGPVLRALREQAEYRRGAEPGRPGVDVRRDKAGVRRAHGGWTCRPPAPPGPGRRHSRHSSRRSGDRPRPPWPGATPSVRLERPEGATHLGVGPRTVRHWQRGRQALPRWCRREIEDLEHRTGEFRLGSVHRLRLRCRGCRGTHLMRRHGRGRPRSPGRSGSWTAARGLRGGRIGDGRLPGSRRRSAGCSTSPALRRATHTAPTS